MKPATQTTQPKTAARRHFEGTVVSAPGHKTIYVEVQAVIMHPKYRKQYSRSRQYAVHDERHEAHVGDTVRFDECRPLSKTKRWLLTAVVTRAPQTIQLAETV